LTWRETLAWLREHTKPPVLLKGVQTYEDAKLAAALFPDVVRSIVLSNHGGRALDTAPPAIQTLLEIRRFCSEVLNQVDMLVDGGGAHTASLLPDVGLRESPLSCRKPPRGWGCVPLGPRYPVLRTLPRTTKDLPPIAFSTLEPGDQYLPS
jgi:hypothetical protein